MGQDSHWGLTAEREYLDGLGSWATHKRSTYGRIALLKSYIKTLPKREPQAWCEPAWEYAKELLRQEEL